MRLDSNIESKSSNNSMILGRCYYKSFLYLHPCWIDNFHVRGVSIIIIDSGKTTEEVLKKLEEDAINILEFMASNGLVANSAKTEFLLINTKDKVNGRKIRVGHTDRNSKTPGNFNGQWHKRTKKVTVQIYQLLDLHVINWLFILLPDFISFY